MSLGSGADEVTSGAEDEPSQPCSAYVTELQNALEVVQREILARFTLGADLTERVRLLMRDILEYFIVNACTLDALSNKGKLRLTADLAQVRTAEGRR